MDSNNWRANHGGEPTGVESGDWRSQLKLGSRQRIVDKMFDSRARMKLCYFIVRMATLKSCLHVPDPEGSLSELKEMAASFEENVYIAAASQADYLRKISLKMLAMETNSKNPHIALPFNSIMSSNKPLNSGNSSTGAQDWRSQLQLESRQRIINNMQLHPDQRLVKSDERVTDLEDWTYLWNYWESPEWLEKNSKGKSSQVALQYNHQANNRSFLTIQENVSEKGRRCRNEPLKTV